MAGERYFRAWRDRSGGWHNADGGNDGNVYATRKEAHEASERAIAHAAETGVIHRSGVAMLPRGEE